MSRMSFLEHLGELRTRILRALIGLGIAYPLCLLFARQLFELVRGPYDMAREQLPQYDTPLTLVALTPMESFHMLYLKIPILAAVFLTSPWLMYQVWAFIAPGALQARASLDGSVCIQYRHAVHSRGRIRLLRHAKVRAGVSGGNRLRIRHPADDQRQLLLQSVRYFVTWPRNRIPNAGFDLFPHVATDHQPVILVEKRPLRDLDHVRDRSRHHPHT